MSGIYENMFELWLGRGAAAHTAADLDTDTIKIGIVDTGTDYPSPDVTTDQDWDDVGTYALDTCYNGESTLTLTNGNTTLVAGVFDNSDDQTFSGVAIDAAKTVDAIVLYRSTGVIGTDALISIHDSFVGGAVTPNDGDIVIAFNASGIFAL